MYVFKEKFQLHSAENRIVILYLAECRNEAQRHSFRNFNHDYSYKLHKELKIDFYYVFESMLL